MLIRHPIDIPPSEITPKKVYLSRREFVTLGAGLAGFALIAFSLPRGRRSQEHYGGWDRYVV